MTDKTKRGALTSDADAIAIEQKVSGAEFRRICKKLKEFGGRGHVNILTNKEQHKVAVVFEKDSSLLRSDGKKTVQKTEGKEAEASKEKHIETTIVVAHTDETGIAHAHWAAEHGYTAVITNINDEKGEFDIAISTVVGLEEKSKETLRRERENRARIM